MTPIKAGTAKRLGLKRPDPVFEFTLSGPDVFGKGGDLLWHHIRQQLRAGVKEVVIDPGALEAHVAKQDAEWQRQAQPFVEALAKRQRLQDVAWVDWPAPSPVPPEAMRVAGFTPGFLPKMQFQVTQVNEAAIRSLMDIPPPSNP